MKELTRAEEEIMQILWKTGGGFVKDLIPHFPDPKPAYNTVSTIIRIMVQKEFVGFESFGNTHRYYPLITKDEYAKKYLSHFIKHYFGNSYQHLVSFMAKEKKISLNDLDELMKETSSKPKKKK